MARYKEYLKENKKWLHEAKSKPKALGSVWTSSATLYDKNKKPIAICMDTPNAIAKAFMELPKAEYVSSFLSNELETKDKYSDRMKSWNNADSQLNTNINFKRKKSKKGR